MSEWQPIETAPKDETSILVCDARVIDSQKVVYWDDNPEKLPWGWCVDDASIAYHQDAFTHWMPLPAQPAT